MDEDAKTIPESKGRIIVWQGVGGDNVSLFLNGFTQYFGFDS